MRHVEGGQVAAELKGFMAQVPSCSPAIWGPGCSRGGSEGARVVAPAGGGLGPPRVDV